jgi:hypothetical protein
VRRANLGGSIVIAVGAVVAIVIVVIVVIVAMVANAIVIEYSPHP